MARHSYSGGNDPAMKDSAIRRIGKLLAFQMAPYSGGMMKRIAMLLLLVTGLLGRAAWADDALNRALFKAIHDENVQEVQTSISHGADVSVALSEVGTLADINNITGNDLLPIFATPLHYALVYKKNKEISRLLARNMVKFVVPFTWGNGRKDKFNILGTAVSSDDLEIVEMLLQRGASVSEKGPNELTPLHFAQSKEMAELLLSRGADVNAKNGEGWTPLHSVADSKHHQVVELLLAKGADINAKDKDGHTPLDIAKKEGNSEFVALAEDAVAARKRDEEVVLILRQAPGKPASDQRKIFNQVLVRYRGHKMSDTVLRPFIALAARLKPAPVVPDEAIQFEGRAQFAFKNARSASDYVEAAQEYEKALVIAPWVPGYYADLCTIYEKAGRYADAKRNCELFLASSPAAEEANEIRKRIAGFSYAIEKGSAPGTSASRQPESVPASMSKRLEGAVFTRQATFDYGTAEWAIHIASGIASYTYEVIQFASDSSVPAGVRGTWRQILMNSGYSGERMILASGRVEGRQFGITRTASTDMLAAGSMKCEVSSDESAISCTGDLISSGETFVFKRK